MSEIGFRTVCEADQPLLFELYASTRESEMDLVPWTAEQKRMFLEMQFHAQRQSYREHYPAAVHDLILFDCRPVGRVYADRSAGRLHILDITIAAADRNAGIGTRVLEQLLQEADSAGWPVSIYVEDFNPSRRLFERLGFQAAKQDGFLLLLERPASGRAAGLSMPAEAASSND